MKLMDSNRVVKATQRQSQTIQNCCILLSQIQMSRLLPSLPLLLLLSLVSALNPVVDDSKDTTTREKSTTYFSEIISPVQGTVVKVMMQPSEAFKQGETVFKIFEKTFNPANPNPYNKGDAQVDAANGTNTADDDSIDWNNLRDSQMYNAKALHAGIMVKILKNVGERVVAGTHLAHVWYAVPVPGHNPEEEW